MQVSHLHPSVPPEPRVFLSRSEVADLFNVSPNTITRWADAGKLNFVRTLGGHRRYEKETIVNLVNAQFVNAQSDEQEPVQEPVHVQKEEADRVNRIILNIPRLYGDHHVAPIQQALANRPGIETLLVSPAHRQVRVDFAPEEVSHEQILAWLTDAGYPPKDLLPPLPEVEHPTVAKDLAWDHTAVRMTQTLGA